MPENLVHIGEVIANGIIFDPKNAERLAAIDFNELVRTVPWLFDLLDGQQVDYVLVGGIAMLVYVEGRNTQDIDLIVRREDLVKLPEIRIEEDNPDFVRGWLGDLRVDFLFPKRNLFEEVRKHHSELRRFAERDVRCASVEGLLLLKLYALPSLYGQFRFDRVRIYENDVAELLEQSDYDITCLMSTLQQYLLASDIAELKRVIADIEDRTTKAGERFRTRDSTTGN